MRKMNTPVVLSLGSVNADFHMRVDRAVEAGGTQLAHDFIRLGGGKAANVAFLACRLGVPARLLGRVGDDELREQALEPLRAVGIDLRHVSTAQGCATGVAMIAVAPDGKKTIVLAANANDAWGEADAQAVVSAIRNAPAGSILVADCEIPAPIVNQAVEAARSRGIPVVIDPSPADRVEPRMLANAIAVTPNPSEAEGLTGIKVDGPRAAAEAARRLAGLGVGLVCQKLADGGCLVAHQGCLTLVPPVPVPPVDSTGAGDAFAGALAIALLERRPPTDAACFAVAAASLAVTAYGSQPAYPTRQRVDELVPVLARNAHVLAPS
jgi:ribokinase